MRKLFLSVLLISFNTFSLALDELNNFFSNKLLFTQTSLNSIDTDLNVSKGTFIRNSDNTIKIEIKEPFREIYTIDDNGIKIHDLEFDQIKKIDKKSFENNLIINIIQNGLSSELREKIQQSELGYIFIDNDKTFYFEFINKLSLGASIKVSTLKDIYGKICSLIILW